jgi:hypothetical protein
MQLTDQKRLRIGTSLVEHSASLWPQGGAPEPEWIRSHTDSLLELLVLPLRHDGQDARRLPRRLHCVLWLLDDLDQGTPRNG